MISLQSIPEALREGENWELLTLDPEWVWLAEDAEGSVVGILIAAPCHGLVFVWRVKILPTAPPWALGKLLRRFIRDLRRRGCLGYIAFLDICAQPAEQALARIAYRAGAMFTTATTVIYGSVNAKHVGER
jgi:hypothetical protein